MFGPLRRISSWEERKGMLRLWGRILGVYRGKLHPLPFIIKAFGILSSGEEGMGPKKLEKN